MPDDLIIELLESRIAIKRLEASIYYACTLANLIIEYYKERAKA